MTTATQPGTQGAPRRRRRPRARTRWRAAFFALAGAGVIAAIAWALLGSRLLVVRSVTVTGLAGAAGVRGGQLVTPAEVLAAADVPLGSSLLRVDTGTVARRVESIRDVASATVSKNWPDHLTIAVTLRVPVVAVRMAGGGYDQLDASGVIVRWAAQRPSRLPLYQPAAGAVRPGDHGLATIAAVLGELSPPLSSQVTAVAAIQVLTGTGASAIAQPTDQVRLTLHDGVTVLWGGTDNAAAKNREIAIMLGRGARTIDVSAPGTVVTSG